MTQRLVPSMSYDEIEVIIKPHWFSVRESVDPLHLHKYGLPLQKFTSKRNLVGYLNLKITGKA